MLNAVRLAWELVNLTGTCIVSPWVILKSSTPIFSAFNPVARHISTMAMNMIFFLIVG